LIAKYETTNADWIEFLSAIPPAKRANFRTKFSNIRGSVEIMEQPGNQWQFTIQPATQVYVARSGQNVEYQGRTTRVSQNWLKFPVCGLSITDVEAYLEWLNTSGRLRGARLCTEQEWERAARGADTREFPHATSLEPDDANYDRTYGLNPLAFGPDTVGSHPASRSPFGVEDMTGNVFEWTRTGGPTSSAVARGGSFYFDATSNRATNRAVIEPTFRDVNVGMRVCVSWPLR
jgi:formylglycine-generating enzyme required for sulfatase activity